MIRRRAVQFVAFLCLLVAVAGGVAIYEGRAASYDYLALALSWSPSYCASEAARDDDPQCAAGRRHGFTVHGLWPEFENGWPEYCASEQGYVPDAVIDRIRNLMPSKGLVIHEWRRHGACSGLTPGGYFAATRTLFERLWIPRRYFSPQTAIVIAPEALADDFLSANPWLARDMMSVRCGDARGEASLDALVFCFTRDLKPRPCGGNERRQCAALLTLPPVR